MSNLNGVLLNPLPGLTQSITVTYKEYVQLEAAIITVPLKAVSKNITKHEQGDGIWPSIAFQN